MVSEFDRVQSLRDQKARSEGRSTSQEHTELREEKVKWIPGNAWPTFFRLLACCHGAGLTLPDSLGSIAKKAPHPKIGELASRIESSLSKGYPLTEAFAPLRSQKPLQYEMIRLGASTGQLDLCLKQSAEYSEREYHHALKLRSALTYPVLIVVSVTVGFLSLCYTFQDAIRENLQILSIEPPLFLRALFTFFGLFRWEVLAVVIPFGLLTWASFARVFSWRRVRLELYRLGHLTPGLGQFLRAVGTAKFLRALAMQQQAGAPIDKSLAQALEATTDPYFIKKKKTLIEDVIKGVPLPGALEGTGLFDKRTLSLITVGDESGELPKLVTVAADILQDEIDHKMEMSMTLIEPFVLVVLGILVGGICLTMMQGMNQLAQAL